MGTGRRKALDGDDLVAGLDVADPDRARPRHLAIDMHGAGTALGDAAAVFGPGETDMLPDHPQERRVRFDLHHPYPSIDVELGHERSSHGLL
jgi:hypothetical protein